MKTSKKEKNFFLLNIILAVLSFFFVAIEWRIAAKFLWSIDLILFIIWLIYRNLKLNDEQF